MSRPGSLSTTFSHSYRLLAFTWKMGVFRTISLLLVLMKSCLSSLIPCHFFYAEDGCLSSDTTTLFSCSFFFQEIGFFEVVSLRWCFCAEDGCSLNLIPSDFAPKTGVFQNGSFLLVFTEKLIPSLGFCSEDWCLSNLIPSPGFYADDGCLSGLTLCRDFDAGDGCLANRIPSFRFLSGR